MTLAENGFPASYVIKFSAPTKREVTKNLRENGKTEEQSHPHVKTFINWINTIFKAPTETKLIF